MSEKETVKFGKESTSGLTSASQFFNATSAVCYEISNTSSATIYYSMPTPLVESESEETKPFKSRRYLFRKALQRSVTENKEILEELSKYLIIYFFIGMCYYLKY